MEDAVTIGILKAAAILCPVYVVVLASLAELKFADRHLSVIVALMVIAWTVACSEYLIAIPVLWIMGLGALGWLYELLVKLERRWDRAHARCLRERPRSQR